jgi:hypothetical protein
LDNPVPTITKRLAIYGTNNDIDTDFKRILKKYKYIHEENPLI